MRDLAKSKKLSFSTKSFIFYVRLGSQHASEFYQPWCISTKPVVIWETSKYAGHAPILIPGCFKVLMKALNNRCQKYWFDVF